MNVSEFLESHFKHFNARELLAAAAAYRQFLESDGQMESDDSEESQSCHRDVGDVGLGLQNAKRDMHDQ